MKAKEYAAEYETRKAAGEDPVKVIVDHIQRFCKEVAEIARERRATSNEAMLSIITEQDRKFLAYARLVKDANPDGFLLYNRETFPFIWLLMRTRNIPRVLKIDTMYPAKKPT